jgi:hypothetical protein
MGGEKRHTTRVVKILVSSLGLFSRGFHNRLGVSEQAES